MRRWSERVRGRWARALWLGRGRIVPSGLELWRVQEHAPLAVLADKPALDCRARRVGNLLSEGCRLSGRENVSVAILARLVEAAEWAEVVGKADRGRLGPGRL